jgi:hypothetical protein
VLQAIPQKLSIPPEIFFVSKEVRSAYDNSGNIDVRKHTAEAAVRKTGQAAFASVAAVLSVEGAAPFADSAVDNWMAVEKKPGFVLIGGFECDRRP